jgi:hypothetical protein
MARLLDEVREVTEQLEPERARSCRNAITMASVMVDEIRLRAHARPSTATNSCGVRDTTRRPDGTITVEF